jgi:hypothetical protein
MRINEYKDYPISIALNSLRDKGFELINIIKKNKYQLINANEQMTLLLETYIPDGDICESVNRMFLINEVITDFDLAFNEAYYYNQLQKKYPGDVIKFYNHYETLYQFKL